MENKDIDIILDKITRMKWELSDIENVIERSKEVKH